MSAAAELRGEQAVSLRRLEHGAGWLAALVLLTPLVVAPWLVFPLLAPKVYWLRTLVALLAAVHVVLLGACPHRYLPPRGVLAGTALVLGSATLSALSGVDLHRSLWDSHERMQGLVTLGAYGVLFLVLTGIVHDAALWRRLWTVQLVAGGAAMALGILQKLQPGFLWSADARVAGPVGHPSYLGGLGAWLVFAAGVARAAATHRLLVLASVPLGIAGVLLSETRGSLLGLVAGLGTLGLLSVWQDRDRRGRRLALLAGLAVLLGSSVLLFHDAPLLREVPGLRRLAGQALTHGSGGTRLLFWQAAVEAWQERPLLGWGPANFYHAFNAHYPSALLDYGRGETWVDRAHNVFLETLVTRGVLGLVALLATLGALTVLARRAHHRGTLTARSAAAAIAALVAQGVHLTFGLEEPTSWLCFVLLAGYLVHVAREPAPLAPRTPAGTARLRLKLGVAATGAAVAVVCWLDARPALADWRWRACLEAVAAALHRATRLAAALARAQPNPGPSPQPRAQGQAKERILARLAADIERAAALYRQGAGLGSPHRGWAGEALAEWVVAAAPSVARLGHGPLLVPLGELGWQELERALALHPRDVRLAIRQVKLAGAILELSGDPRRLALAADRLEAMRRFSPERQEVLSELAAAHARLGSTDRMAGIEVILRRIEAERAR